MQVWVVLEDDRGCGPSVIKVFFSEQEAEHLASQFGHLYVDGPHDVESKDAEARSNLEWMLNYDRQGGA